MEKTKRNIVDAPATPGVADIEIESVLSRTLRIIDLSDDAESDGEPADLEWHHAGGRPRTVVPDIRPMI